MQNTLIAVLLTVASAARANETIAIMDFTAANASASEAVAVSGFVRSAVVRAGTYTVVDKKNMDRILQEQAFQQTGCTSQECAVKLGKLLNVKKMVVGEYTMLGGTRFLTASLVDVESGRIERSGKIKGFEVGNADEAAEQLVEQLEGRATVARPQQQPAPAYTPPAQTMTTAVAQPAYAAPPRVKPRSYFALSVGPAMATKLTGMTRTSDYTWSSGTHSGEKLYVFTLSPVEMQTTGPAAGMRFGFTQGNFGLDIEIGHVAMTNVPDQKIEVATTGGFYNSFGTYVPYQDFTYTMTGNDLTVSSWDFGMNLCLAASSGAVVPYVGAGFGFAVMNVTSDFFVDDSGLPLDSSAMAFSLQLPIGLRIYASEKFFFWGEVKPTFQPMLVGYKTDKPKLTSTDTFNLNAIPITFGIGFGF